MVEVADGVVETSPSPGTATTFALAGAVTARSSFASKFNNGDIVFYFADNGIDLEYGYGALTYGSPNRVARSTVIGNSRGTTSRIPFTGTTYVYNDVPASHLLWISATGGFSMSLFGAISMATSSTASFFSSGNMLVSSDTGNVSVQTNSGNVSVSSTSGTATLGGGTGATFLLGGTNLSASANSISFGITGISGSVGFFNPDGNFLINANDSTLSEPIFSRTDGIALRHPSYSSTHYGAETSAIEVFRETGVGIDVGIGPPSGTTFLMRFINWNTGVIGSIATTTGFGTVVYNTVSDYRLKTNVTLLSSALARLENLRPVQFNWIGYEDGPVVDGFLAHEVAAVVPQAVTGEKDAMTEDGVPKHQQMDQTNLVPLLTASLIELHAMVRDLQRQLADKAR